MLNVWTISTVIFSSLIKGVTGFGFALISLPILLLWSTPQEAVPVLALCNLLASTAIVIQRKPRGLISKKSLVLIVTGGFFTIGGVAMLKFLHGKTLIHICGVFFIIMALFSLKETRDKKVFSYLAYALAGAIVGLVAGILSISGPPLALFLNKAKVSNREFREIFAWYSIVTASIGLAGYHSAGMFGTETIKSAAVFVPIIFFGVAVGKKINNWLSNNNFRKINVFLTLVSSIMLVFV